jgi:hypothetical protein
VPIPTHATRATSERSSTSKTQNSRNQNHIRRDRFKYIHAKTTEKKKKLFRPDILSILQTERSSSKRSIAFPFPSFSCPSFIEPSE